MSNDTTLPVQATLSADARNALVWLSCSGEAGKLTAREARQRLAELFGISTNDELERFFSDSLL